MQQPAVIKVHNNLLDNTEDTLTLFIRRKCSDCLIVVSIANIEPLGKDIIFNLIDRTKT